MPPKKVLSPTWLLGATALCGLADPTSAQERSYQELAERVLQLETLLDDHLAHEDDSGLGMTASYEDILATFQLFGDVGFGYVEDPVPPDGHTDATFGSLDFVVNVGPGDHFRAFSETVVSGKAGDTTAFSQERLWVSWMASDQLYAKVGTEHSPMLRWNQLYHHGKWLEPTIARPVVAAS